MKAKGIFITLSCILGLVAVGMAFLPAFQLGDTTYTGLQAALGYTESVEVAGKEVLSTKILDMNLLSTVQYALPIIGIIIALIATKSRLAAFIGFIVFVGAGVEGYFSLGSFPETVLGGIGELGDLLGGWEQTIPCYVSMGASALSGLLLFFRMFTK